MSRSLFMKLLGIIAVFIGLASLGSPAYAIISEVSITDQFIPGTPAPGGYGPPTPDTDKITYVDDGGISSWTTTMQIWDTNYVPTSGQDTAHRTDSTLDSGNGNNPGKTLTVTPYNKVYAILITAGTVYYNFHTFAFNNGGQRFDAYTGPRFLNYHGHL